jgi:hypothetical protein
VNGHGLSLAILPFSSVATKCARMKGNDIQHRRCSPELPWFVSVAVSN